MLLLLCTPLWETPSPPPPATYVARYGTCEQSFEGDGVFRYRAIPLTCQGEVLYYAPSGKVQKGQMLLCGYPLAYRETVEKLMQCEAQLQALNTPKSQETDTISYLLREIRIAKEKGQHQKQALLVSRLDALLLGWGQNHEKLKQTIEEKQRECLSLLPAPLDTVTAEQDGYFIPSCDGWESVWDMDKPSLSWQEQYQTPPAPPSSAKLLTSLSFGVELYLSPDEAGCLEVKQSYPLTSQDGYTFEGILETLTYEQEGCVAHFAIHDLPTLALPSRLQRVKVTYQSKTYLRVPSEAVEYTPEGQSYVLIWQGSRLVARGVDIALKDNVWAWLSPKKGTLFLYGKSCYFLHENEMVLLHPTASQRERAFL